MKLVLSIPVVRQLWGILDASRNKFATRVSLVGRRAGERVVIESACRTEKQPVGNATRVVGEMFFHPDRKVFFHPDDLCRLNLSEKQHIAGMLREKNELAVVVTVIARGGDLVFYPVYFSRNIPCGVDMALEYEGSTVCQQYSALGGSCRAPHETKIRTQTAHRQVPVYIQGRWIPIDRKIARLVRLVNQIPGIASIMSCQGGRSDTAKSRRRSARQAYLELAPVQYASVDFFLCVHLNAVAGEPDPRLTDITHRLQLRFEQRIGKSLAATRARHPLKAWERKGIPEMYPKLRLRSLQSTFYWDPKETPEMLASVEDLLREDNKVAGEQGKRASSVQ